MELRFAQPVDIEALIRLRLRFFEEDAVLALDELRKDAVKTQLRGYFAQNLRKPFIP